MSDIPRARQILQGVMDRNRLNHIDRRQIRIAITLMHRVKWTRKAPAKAQPVNDRLKQQIRQLYHHTNLTQHEIANRVGLRRGGTISEVMHGKR